MKKVSLAAMFLMMAPACAFAADGNVLINQATVNATGGFPYTISQSGSYRLSGNLTVPNATTTAVNITASNVTLDLNGFGIFGPNVCSGGPPVTSCTNLSTLPPPIGVHSTAANVTIINGTISGMGIGIELLGIGGVVDRVRLVSNAGIGVLLTLGTLSNSIMLNNGQYGASGNNVNVTGNIVSGSYYGLGVYGIVSGNIVENNTIGINLSCPSVAVGNTVLGNVNANIVPSTASCVLANNVQ